jgi:hypothetical protein
LGLGGLELSNLQSAGQTHEGQGMASVVELELSLETDPDSRTELFDIQLAMQNWMVSENTTQEKLKKK